tara:strand:- start:2191 stop:2532 length:342 start_codon:yes stop_codon:yes gene_type:complete
MKESINIKISTDFSKTPGPRYEKEGKHSGEVFRNTILAPKVKQALKEGKGIVVNLDGTAGFGTSFLEEAFGGLVREDKIPFKDLKKHLSIVSEEETYLKEDIWDDMKEASDYQ